jgi:Uma2 family endonuclease
MPGHPFRSSTRIAQLTPWGLHSSTSIACFGPDEGELEARQPEKEPLTTPGRKSYSEGVSQRPAPWVVDPDNPMAPPQELWDRLSEAERKRVVESFPSEFEASEAHPPEGDLHTEAVFGARTALKRFFGKLGRRVYVATNLPVYYPGRSMFSPDVMAVLDVPTHHRASWVVSREGKGLDFALEVMVLGHRRKDVERNVELYAQLGIQEYFVFDRPKLHLQGYRLRASGKGYEPLVPQHGYFPSQVLGLTLRVEAERLRFFAADAELPDADALIAKLEHFADDLLARVADAEQRAAHETERAAHEAERADVAEAQLREALAQLERLKRDPS